MTTHLTFDFLKELKANNYKAWFTEHKEMYEQSKKETESLSKSIYDLIEKMDQINPAKVYRIYKDVRFSKDKTPYKEHMGIHISRAQPYHRGSFYIHIEPDNSFIAGGFWNPEPKDLLRIRQAFQFEKEITQLLANKALIANFGALVGEEVKTTPKGFAKDLERIDLIKKKQFLLIKKFSNEEVLQASFVKEVADAYQILLPFYHYMTDILITDANGEFLF